MNAMKLQGLILVTTGFRYSVETVINRENSLVPEEKHLIRIITLISFEDLYQILEDLNKRFCLQRSLRIFYRSFKDLLKILVLKDLWQVFVNP